MDFVTMHDALIVSEREANRWLRLAMQAEIRSQTIDDLDEADRLEKLVRYCRKQSKIAASENA